MVQEWIAELADEIKQKNRAAAQDYGRAQHYAGIVAEAGKGFFVALVSYLQEDVVALRSQLQGDLTAAETAVQTIQPGEVKIARARFPWVDAHLVHREDTLMLDYAKGPGAGGDPTFDRKTRSYVLRAAADDSLYAEEAFSDSAKRYTKPEDLAREMMEILFGV